MPRLSPAPARPAWHDLAESGYPLALATEERYARRYPRQASDVAGLGALTLAQAARTWHEGRGMPWPLFLAWRLRGRLARAVRAGKRRLDTPGDFRRGVRDHLAAAPGAEAEASEELAWLLGRLEPRRAAVLRLTCLDGRSGIEAAAAMGLSTSRASTLKGEAIDAAWGLVRDRREALRC
jgi:DNA-directed RNA polymerase specialized sigma24 family protein